MPVEKVIPRLADLATLLPLLTTQRDRPAHFELRDDDQRSATRR